MTTVTKDAFFAAIGPLDVVIRIEGNWRDGNGVSSIFETRARRVVGTITRQGLGVPHIYTLAHA